MKEAEIEFRNIVLLSVDAIIVTDAEGKIAFMNPAAQKLFKDKLGKNIGLPLIDGQTTEIDISCPEKASGIGEMHVAETEWQNKKAYLITIYDITQCKRLKEKIRAVFDQTFQFIGMMTVDGILIEANKTAMEFSGIHESDCLGKPFWETPWWTHSTEMQNKLRKAITDAAGGKTVVFEATHATADGTIHYIDFSIKPLKDENGKVIFLIPEGRDITERKKMEETLKEQIHDMNILLDAAMDREETMIELKEKIKRLEEKLREKK
jgi:PAS domain S-box-containing protein